MVTEDVRVETTDTVEGLLVEATDSFKLEMEIAAELKQLRKEAAEAAGVTCSAVHRLGRLLNVPSGGSLTLLRVNHLGGLDSAWNVRAGTESPITGEPQSYTMTPQGFLAVRVPEQAEEVS